MQKLNKTGELSQFEWTVAEKGSLPMQQDLGKQLIHVATFVEQFQQLESAAALGVWFDSEDEVKTVAGKLAQVRSIGIQFPLFTDGRGFSIARQLRDSCGFKGELIALGAFMQDQLFFLKRCGFDAFVVSEEADIASMQHSLQDFSEYYQAAVDEPRPLFRRR